MHENIYAYETERKNARKGNDKKHIGNLQEHGCICIVSQYASINTMGLSQIAKT